MKHIITTRVKFNDDGLFNQYFEVMKKTYIPSISRQTNKNFKLGIIANEQHRQIIRESIPSDIEIIFFKSETIDIHNMNDEEIYENYIVKENINIQTRQDCDDWMSDNYIEKIQEKYLENINNNESFIIDTQPLKLDYNTGEVYQLGFIYNKNMCSMFLSLCQKNCKTSVFEKKHSEMGQVGITGYFKLDGIFTNLVIHNSNKLSKIIKSDLLLGKKQKKGYDISIIIPTFNNVDYIFPCLDSLLNSTINISAEILVGIDNCEKSLSAIKKNLQKYYDKVSFYYFDKNVGPYVIKNTLSTISHSENILFFDSDDLMTENGVPAILNDLKKFDFVKFSYNNFKSLSDLQKNDIYKLNGTYGEGVFGIKKNLFLKLNGFEPWKCAADSEFNWRVKSESKKINLIHKILFFRRKHSTSLTVSEETGWKSLIRMEYAMRIQQKKKNKESGPLSQLTKSSFHHINFFGDLTDYQYYNDFSFLETNQIIKIDSEEESQVKKKLENISNLTLKRQTIKPILQEKRLDYTEKKEYIIVDNTGVVNNLISKRTVNPEPVLQTTPQTKEIINQPQKINTIINKPKDAKKTLIGELRKNMSQNNQKIKPDGFVEKKNYNKGSLKRRGGDFNF